MLSGTSENSVKCLFFSKPVWKWDPCRSVTAPPNVTILHLESKLTQEYFSFANVNGSCPTHSRPYLMMHWSKMGKVLLGLVFSGCRVQSFLASSFVGGAQSFLEERPIPWCNGTECPLLHMNGHIRPKIVSHNLRMRTVINPSNRDFFLLAGW